MIVRKEKTVLQEHLSDTRRKENHTDSMVTCRQCGEKHLTIMCPLRTPEERPKSWKQQQDEFDEIEESRPYKCTVRMHPGKTARICSAAMDEFWCDIRVTFNHSLYRDFAGVQKKDSNELFPPDYPLLEPGEYKLISRTHAFSDKQLFSVIADGVANLKKQRALLPEIVKRVQSDFLLQFNHFSLSHEGNSLELDETRMLTNMLRGKDWKHTIEDKEVGVELREIPGSEHDLKEAVNHILVSQQLPDLAKHKITETVILQLHGWIMSGLLENTEEGFAGEYRKVSIGVEGSTRGRAPFADVPPLMRRFFDVTMVKTDDEDLLEFLARIHSEFQYIHPFRDGNGRIGRMLMNLHLMKNGYPVLVLPTTTSNMFNHGVEMGHRGNLSIFTRLLAEAVFHSLQIYEDALAVRILPSVEEIMELKVADSPAQVSP